MRPVLPFALLLLTPACGAVMTSRTVAVAIQSAPPGATVRHGGRIVGTTPCSVDLHRDAHVIELAMAGHRRRLVDVGLQPNAWLIGNLATLGLGLFVDMALGADRVVNSDPVFVEMVPGDGNEVSLWFRASAREQPPRHVPAPNRDAEGLGHLIASLIDALAASRDR
jgi:hypothetical protein